MTHFVQFWPVYFFWIGFCDVKSKSYEKSLVYFWVANFLNFHLVKSDFQLVFICSLYRHLQYHFRMEEVLDNLSCVVFSVKVCVKHFPHTWHSYDFSSVWVFWCKDCLLNCFHTLDNKMDSLLYWFFMQSLCETPSKHMTMMSFLFCICAFM